MGMDDCLIICKFKRVIPIVQKWLTKENIGYITDGFTYKGPSHNVEKFVVEADSTDHVEPYEILSGVIRAHGDFFQFFAVALSFDTTAFKTSKHQQRILEVKMFTDIFQAIEFSEARKANLEREHEKYFKKFIKKIPW